MLRSSLLLSSAAALLVLTGCTSLDYAQHIPRSAPVYQPTASHSEAYDVRHSSEWRRVERDARRYVRDLDRELHLDRRQSRVIQDIVTDRAYRHLERTRRRDLRRAYPFPRRWQVRYQDYRSRSLAQFWRRADNAVERQLDRYQRREFQYMTGQYRTRAYRYDRGRWHDYHAPRRDYRRYDHRRYDDRRNDRRYDRDDRRGRDDGERRDRRDRRYDDDDDDDRRDRRREDRRRDRDD